VAQPKSQAQQPVSAPTISAAPGRRARAHGGGLVVIAQNCTWLGNWEADDCDRQFVIRRIQSLEHPEETEPEDEIRRCQWPSRIPRKRPVGSRSASPFMWERAGRRGIRGFAWVREGGCGFHGPALQHKDQRPCDREGEQTAPRISDGVWRNVALGIHWLSRAVIRPHDGVLLRLRGRLRGRIVRGSLEE
jgi:hypothetical protein